MTLFDFFCQDRKKIQKDLQAVGVTNYRDLPHDVAGFVKLLNLGDSSNITYMYLDSMYQQYCYSFDVDIPMKEPWKDMFYIDSSWRHTTPLEKRNPQIKLYITFNGKCHVKDLGISYSNSIELVSYPCDFYTNKNGLCTYNINKPYYTSWPNFETIQDVMNFIYGIFNEDEPYISKALEYCKSNDMIDIYNTVSSVKITRGKLSDLLCSYTRMPDFMTIVYVIKYFKTVHNYDISMQEIVAYGLYIYEPKRQDIIKKYSNINNPCGPFSVNEFIDANEFTEIPEDVKLYNLDPSITLDRWKEIFESIFNTDLINKRIKWKTLYETANNEYNKCLSELKKTIAEKYNIPEKYVGGYLDFNNFELPTDVEL